MSVGFPERQTLFLSLCSSQYSNNILFPDEEVDEVFEIENSWRLQSLSWCKCGQCTLSTKAIESFCFHEKALEYDEHDGLLSEAEYL